MPKPSTIPTLYNDALKLKISDLKHWGYLKHGYRQMTYRWNRQDETIASIGISIHFDNDCRFIELDYSYRGEPRKYKVEIISKPSNLNKGELFFFVCPKTKKLCRKLYLIGGYFLHREAFKGCLYETQTQSKKYRELEKTLRAYFKSDNLYSELYKKNFKKSYAGKPTKKYLRIMEQIQKAESIPYHEIERALLS